MVSKVPAATSALQILSHLARRRGPVSAVSIAGALGLPRSTVYHLLAVMRDQGFVVHLPEEGRYGLGLAAYELSSAYVRQAPIARLGQPLLRGLVDRIGETAHLAVLHGRDVVYVIDERAPGRPSLISAEGVRLPAFLTASGRAMLAELPVAQVRAIYPDRESLRSTFAGERSWSHARLRAELQRTRARGWATEEESEIMPGFASVAVVARDHLDLPTAAVAATFAGSVTQQRRADIVAEVRVVADALTRRLHGRPGSQTG